MCFLFIPTRLERVGHDMCEVVDVFKVRKKQVVALKQDK